MSDNTREILKRWIYPGLPLASGVFIALVFYGISKIMPEVPAASMQLIGLIIFAFTAVYTIVSKLIKSFKNVNTTYKQAKGRDVSADEE